VFHITKLCPFLLQSTLDFSLGSLLIFVNQKVYFVFLLVTDFVASDTELD
jgi:hypothetical protein